MQRTIVYHLNAENAGCDIRTFLRAQGYSRHILAHLKPLPDAVLINGAHAFLRQILHPGDVLQIHIEDPLSSPQVIPAPVPFSIVFEDEDLLVINKPAGVSIHPAPGHPADTLANGLADYYRQQGIPFVFRCINRLDRDTTGLLLVAKHLISASILEAMLQKHEIRRTYFALAEGELPNEGTIDLPIARKPGSLIERCVAADGDRAVTHYTALPSDFGVRTEVPTRGASRTPALGERSELSTAVFEPGARAFHGGVLCPDVDRPATNVSIEMAPRVTPLQLRLETGRTHQIRVHLAAIGHPLLGDSLYNPRWREQFEKGQPKPDAVFPYGLKRQALHSWKLDLTHPIKKEPMHFTAPVPEDLWIDSGQIGCIQPCSKDAAKNGRQDRF